MSKLSLESIKQAADRAGTQAEPPAHCCQLLQSDTLIRALKAHRIMAKSAVTSLTPIAGHAHLAQLRIAHHLEDAAPFLQDGMATITTTGGASSGLLIDSGQAQRDNSHRTDFSVVIRLGKPYYTEISVLFLFTTPTVDVTASRTSS